MKKAVVLTVVLLLCLMITAHSATLQNAGIKPSASAQVLQSFNRNALLSNLNKQVTLEGFYYKGTSTPILVQDLKLVLADEPIPPDKYVPLSGQIPSSLKLGEKVKLNGLVQKPTGDGFAGENAALQVSGSPSLLQAAPTILSPGLIGTMTPVQPGVTTTSGKYALLIGGGKNSACNWWRYWNDLKVTYMMLLSKGYSPANIRVAYAWGGVPTGASGMPVNYPATIGGIQAAFGYFVPKVKSTDTFFIMVVGQTAPPGDPNALSYWTWQNIPMTRTAFALQVNRITSFQKEIIHFNPSYSGSWIPPLVRTNRIIVTSSAANQTAWSTPTGAFGNFNYYYLSALWGRYPTGGAVNADANGNGKVSIGEAYNFTLGKPGNPPLNYQQPQFEGNYTLPSHFGPVPAAGEGSNGLNTYP